MNTPFHSKHAFIKTFSERLESTYLKTIESSSVRERFNILGTLVREEIAKSWMNTQKYVDQKQPRQVHYFSMEFLLGRLLTNSLMSLGVRDVVEAAFKDYGIDLTEMESYEADPGLGTGGLGRLAACYLDSMSAIGVFGIGHCIRYRYGLFRQKIKNGYQEERPDNWLSDGSVWEIRREEEAEDIPFNGYVVYDHKMNYVPSEFIRAVPYDIPIIGAGNGVVNYLRLWNAEPSRKYPKHISPFAYEQELQNISGFLYPDDTTDAGKRLRLMQQYFFASAGVKSVCRKHKAAFHTLSNLAQYHVFHINDTHPTFVIPELMRILLDEENMEWDEAWGIVTNSVAYTNHTILAEALEKWPIPIIQPLLPRIYQLIEEINRRFCNQLLEIHGHQKLDWIQRMAIIQRGMVHMAHLCVVSSYSVNGVAKLHTQILKDIEMRDFHQIFPDKFKNVTNGITHRRWLLYANPELADILDRTIGKDYRNFPEKLSDFARYQDDTDIQNQILHMKLKKKQSLAERIKQEQNIDIDPTSIFDIQVKRLHEYKRQLMNALNIMDIYHRLKTDAAFKEEYVPHTFIFGAKAAATYYFAKKVIKLINTLQTKINQDPDTNAYLKVVFVENYNVSYAEVIMPACDLSEQISTASKEASGTGNMKFMMNGALTIGTEDGANVEIHELVGDDHIFIFGMNAEEVTTTTQGKTYVPKDLYDHEERIRRILDQLINGFFTEVDRNEFREIFDKLVFEDPYYVLKDFHAYQKAHLIANERYRDHRAWARSMIMNIAMSGVFSSDRSIRDYCKTIWQIDPIGKLQ